MRRWLVIALLALLPFQFTWAAVASHCGHETNAQAPHHGHQLHGDASVDQGPGDVAGQALGSGDLDCDHCHGGCSAMPAPGVGLMPLAITAHPLSLAAGLVRTLAHSPPERPQWAALA